jgi:hypothetical protein
MYIHLNSTRQFLFLTQEKEEAKMRRRKVLVKVLACLFFLPLSASFVLAHPTAKVPKTGITNCSTYGEDGCYKKGVPWSNPRFTINGDKTVTDNLTGLMWTQSAFWIANQNWAGAINSCVLLELGQNGCNTYTDWRLANINEMQSLLHRGYYNPALSNTAGTGQYVPNDPFYSVHAEVVDYYWTSSTYAASVATAWTVTFWSGLVLLKDKEDDHYVWCVRGGQ